MSSYQVPSITELAVVANIDSAGTSLGYAFYKLGPCWFGFVAACKWDGDTSEEATSFSPKQTTRRVTDQAACVHALAVVGFCLTTNALARAGNAASCLSRRLKWEGYAFDRRNPVSCPFWMVSRSVVSTKWPGRLEGSVLC